MGVEGVIVEEEEEVGIVGEEVEDGEEPWTFPSALLAVVIFEVVVVVEVTFKIVEEEVVVAEVVDEEVGVSSADRVSSGECPMD